MRCVAAKATDILVALKIYNQDILGDFGSQNVDDRTVYKIANNVVGRFHNVGRKKSLNENTLHTHSLNEEGIFIRCDFKI